MIDAAKRHFFQRLIDDTIGYYRVYDFLKLKFQTQTDGRIEFQSSKDFWEKIIKDDPTVKHKQVVKLKDFFITEWVPKLPGRVWTNDGRQNLLEGLHDVNGYYSIMDKIYKVLGPTGKMKVMMGGYGSLRLKPTANTDHCTVLNLVHVDDWHCDYGIPLVVSKSVYEEFIKYREHEGAPWIEELTGVLFIDTDIPNINKIPNTIGSKLEPELVDILGDQPNLRKAFIYCASPLDVKIRYNGTCPDAIAWTLFKTSIANEPLRLTYAKFNPRSEESLLEAVGFLNQYVINFDGTQMLTDFDGIQRRLMSKSTLTVPSSLAKQHSGVITMIDKWVSQESRAS